MATRYWVGVNNPGWDNSNTANWSTSSGGSGGASCPTSADDVILDTGGTGERICTVTANVECKTLTLSAGQPFFWIGATPFTVTIHEGGLTGTCLNSGILKFKATTGTHTVTTDTSSVGDVIIDGVGGTFNLSGGAGAFNIGTLTLLGGTVNLTDSDGYNIGSIVSSGSGVRTLNLSSSVLTFREGTGYTTPINFSGSNFTFDAGTSSLLMSNTNASNKVFAGGGKTFYDVTFDKAHTITGSNSFHNLVISGSTNPDPVFFTESTTQTISGTFTATGSAGNLVYLKSTSVLDFYTLSAASVSLSYLSVKDSFGAGAATWAPTNSVSDGGNFNWSFGSESTKAVEKKDLITLTESVTVQLAYAPSKSDSVTLTDVPTVYLPFLAPNVSQTVTVTESTTRLITEYKPIVSDTVTLIDVASGQASVGGISVSDTPSITESVTVSIYYPIFAVQTVTVSESVTPNRVYCPSVYDSILVEEVKSVGNSRDIFDVEQISVTESVSLTMSDLKASVYDTVQASPSHTVAESTTVVSVYESISLSESRSVVQVLGVVSYESVGVNPVLTILPTILGPVSMVETVSVSETWSTGILVQVSVLETATVAEYANQFTFHDCNLTDSVTHSEELGHVLKNTAIDIQLDLESEESLSIGKRTGEWS